MIRTTVELARVAAGLISDGQKKDNAVVRRGMRIAGARYVMQGAITLAVPEFRVVGIVVDGLHALSMIGVAAVSRKYRRPALSQAGLAAVFGITEALVLRGSLAVAAPPKKASSKALAKRRTSMRKGR